MPDKYRAPHTTRIWYSQSKGFTSSPKENLRTFDIGDERITYQSGKRLPSGHWPWKECTHTTHGTVNPIYATALCSQTRLSDGKERYENRQMYLNTSAPSEPSGSYDTSVVSSLFSQLDLNVTESVLLYSGVLQAVPLLGSAMKFTSILNRAAKKLSKSFRKQPFTTVVKSLISLDFIDRFVISPTIDDARKFADATNYVLRVINTARERNSHVFALESGVKTVISSQETTGSTSGGSYRWWYIRRSRQELESKAFALLEAKYDVDSVSPLKLWAARVGLTRPLDSVWDLIPFSFVIDYFTRAGDFISALSDEMSSQSGLTGRIVRIHDLWGTFVRRGSVSMELTDISWPGGTWYDSDFSAPLRKLVTRPAIAKNETFTRFRIKDPWSYLLACEKKIDDYLTVSLPSTTQKRTIAELIIQAKL